MGSRIWTQKVFLGIAFLAIHIDARPSYSQGFKDNCRRLIKIFTGNSAFAEERVKRGLPSIVEKHRATWLARLNDLPEKGNRISKEKALQALSELRNRSSWSLAGTKLRNETYSVGMSYGQNAIVKYQAQHEAGTSFDSHIRTVMNSPRYEVLAFALDRYLGAGLVPPALMLDDTTSASLRICAFNRSLTALQKRPEHLMDLSHLLLIDRLVSNLDRGHAGNLMETKLGRPLAIDFDLSNPKDPQFGFGEPPHLFVSGVLLEPERRVFRRGDSPGIFAKSVVEKMRAMDADALDQITRPLGLRLTSEEIQSVLGASRVMLRAISLWKQAYGAHLIEIE